MDNKKQKYAVISLSGGTGITTSITTGTTTYNIQTNQQIMQNKVAIFKVTRDEDEKIIKTEFIKELWVETKNGQSVDFQVARDKDLAKYEMSDLSIRTITTLSF
jgi:hypothetical protein